MKFNLRKLARSLAVTLVATIGLGLIPAVTFAAQPPCFQYSSSGNFTTQATPVFNDICGDTTQLPSSTGSYTFGNESDFVRIRPDTSGDVTSYTNNPALVTNQLSASCNSGDKFDVWTYIHNDALSQDNNNGTGSAVAKNVQLDLSAPNLNKTEVSFPFTGTVSADNAAATVTDSVSLVCNGQAMELTLVPGSVHYTTDVASTNFNSLPDSAVNSTFQIGNPVWGNGIQWGCYNYRVVVVYQVQLQAPPQTPVTPTTPVTPVTPVTTTTLVNTGPGSTIGIFAATTLAGAVIHRIVSQRRIAKRSSN